MSAVYADEVQRDLPHATAEFVFLASGFEAACGFPLPDGSLPVAGKGLGGMRLMSPVEWSRYRDLCAGERLAFEI